MQVAVLIHRPFRVFLCITVMKQNSLIPPYALGFTLETFFTRMRSRVLFLLMISACSLAHEALGCIGNHTTEVMQNELRTNLWKRGKGLDVDLNLEPPAEEVPSTSNQDEHANDLAQSSAVQRQENASHQIDMLEQRRILKNKKAVEARRKQKAIWEEAVANPSMMTPEIILQINKHYQGQRNRQKKYYDNLSKEVKSSSATARRVAIYNRTHMTKKWRSISDKNEARYQTRLSKERGKRQKIKEQKSKLQKRGLTSNIDLNSVPTDEELQPELPTAQQQSEVQDPLDVVVTDKKRKRGRPRIQPEVKKQNDLNRLRLWREKQKINKQEKAPDTPIQKTERKRGRPRIPEEVKRQNNSIRSKNWKRKQKARFDEALKDSSKMNPKIEAEMKKYIELRKASSKKRYKALNAKVKSNAEITPLEFKQYHSLHRTAQWRSASKENQAAYELHLSLNRQRRKKAKDNKNTDEPQLRKRANGIDIDLNQTPPKEEEDEVDVRTNNAAAVTEPSKVRLKDMSTEQKRERERVRRRAAAQRRKQEWNEAMNDRSKMTPKISESIKNYKIKKELGRKRRQERWK